jgi:CheY-like chemotaxis protein
VPEERTILVADDDENDVFLLRRAFEKAGISHTLTAVWNGAEAIAYLRGDGIYSDRQKYPWPELLLLDLKMPVLDGFEVLAWWQTEESAGDLPIIVLSSSNREQEIHRAMELGARGYCAKPADFDYFVMVAHELQNRWLLPRPALH